MFKKFLKTLALSLGLISLCSPLVQASSSVNLIVNGSYLNEDLAEIKDSRTYIPLRLVAENLGLDVFYNGENKEVKISKDKKEILLYLDKDQAIINKESYKLDQAPYLKESRTMVPLRFIAESLDQEVYWNQKSKTAIIGKAQSPRKDSQRLYLDSLYAQVDLPKEWSSEIKLSYDFASQGDLAIVSKQLKDYLEKNNLDGDGIIFLVENSQNPLLDPQGLNLDYDPDLERFVYLSKSIVRPFPEEIAEDLQKLQDKYIQAFKSLKLYPNLDKKLAGYEILKGSDSRTDLTRDLSKLKSLIVPWYYFENTLTYIKSDSKEQKLYLPNFKDRKSSDLDSKIEISYDLNNNMEKFFLKFYQEPKRLAQSSFSEDYAKREIKFFMKEILGYKDDNMPELFPEKNVLFGDFQKDHYKGFVDSLGNKYIFNMSIGYLEYMSK
ncbi:MAG: copper amine oxidase N-terminal domain-containing protein [Bacillota bacterium]|nr:copper amine oxidase N-terminal domain-containing protein [Bacillota bacterium]